jgi:hypothetical protein
MSHYRPQNPDPRANERDAARQQKAANVGSETPEETSDRPGQQSGGEEHVYGRVPAE